MTHRNIQNLDLSSQTAIVFGASKGIGRATAEVLAGYGAQVVLTSRNAKRLGEAVEAITATGGTSRAKVCDVTDYTAVEAVVAGCERVDIVVNNAGTIEPLSHLADSDPSIWAQAVHVNLIGTYHGMRAALPRMREQGSGTIVNISSGAANGALVGWSHYCATKAGAQKLTAVAHKEVGEHGVRIVGLSPGTVATDMMRTIRDSGINAVSALDWSAHIPPHWAGEGVAYLCGAGGAEFAGRDFSIKTPDGRARVGLPTEGAPDNSKSFRLHLSNP